MNHLKQKFLKKIQNQEKQRKVPESLFGVRISDNELENVTIPREANIYDNINIGEAEKKSIAVLPSDTFYNSIKKIKQINKQKFHSRNKGGMGRKGRRQEIIDKNTKIVHRQQKGN